ncbi:MAG: menaquinone-dependent protoporphyrinogen IX dehydrogenase [Propionivibrio sp.]
MSRLLLLYSTVDGQTLRICERMKCVIEALGSQVALASLDDGSVPDLNVFDKIVIGASIRYGKYRPSVFAFIEANRRVLDARPTAFFSVNIVARKADKNRPETNPYVRTFLCRTAWRPTQLAVFAGRLDYPRYGCFNRQIIRLIMRITKGPTDPSSVVEFTDWNAVEAFARNLDAMR